VLFVSILVFLDPFATVMWKDGSGENP